MRHLTPLAWTTAALLALAPLGCGDADDADSAQANNASTSGQTTDTSNGATTGDTSNSGTTNAATTPPEGCANPGTPGATAQCLAPTFPPEYYVDEALKYFDTLDVDADRSRVPNYHPLVARWEWPPWLLLTGYTREEMIQTGDTLRDIDPSTVPERDCRFFDTQPFARCYVVFEYEGGLCPIYEEFTFNDQGETTFIEAWSFQPGMMPMDPDADPWAEGPDVARLANRVPGLGNATGTIDAESPWMIEAGERNPDVADFALRTTDMWGYWTDAYLASDPNFFAIGCGWPVDEEGGE